MPFCHFPLSQLEKNCRRKVENNLPGPKSCQEPTAREPSENLSWEPCLAYVAVTVFDPDDPDDPFFGLCHVIYHDVL